MARANAEGVDGIPIDRVPIKVLRWGGEPRLPVEPGDGRNDHVPASVGHCLHGGGKLGVSVDAEQI